MSDSPKKKSKQSKQLESLDDKSLEIENQEQKKRFDFPKIDHESNKQKNAKSSKKNILIALGAIVILAVGAYAYLGQSEPEMPVSEPSPTTIQPSETSNVPTEEAPATPPTESTAEVADQSMPIVQEKVLVDDSILKEPVAEDSTLQQEEIDKLNEIEKQLEEQKSNLEAQSQDVDELIRLKEAQIKALEAELAKQK